MTRSLLTKDSVSTAFVILRVLAIREVGGAAGAATPMKPEALLTTKSNETIEKFMMNECMGRYEMSFACL